LSAARAMLNKRDVDNIFADALQAGLEDPIFGGGDAEAAWAEKESGSVDVPAPVDCEPCEPSLVLCGGAVRVTHLKRAAKFSARLGEGVTIRYRVGPVGDETECEDVVGGRSLPWALDIAARRCALGDIVEVAASGEYCLSDEEENVTSERTWRFELLQGSGKARDKFSMTSEERMTAADAFRERGNAMLKSSRLLRAIDYYEKGSSLMDVVEAEDLPGGAPPEAVAINKRLRECQLPLLLNWSLALIRLRRWSEAERKCTEVLQDINSSSVKALFRRGQCHIELGNLDEARVDLRRAEGFDQSIASDVAREIAKIERKQKALDRKDRGWAQKAFKNGLGDGRSVAPGDDGDEGIECHIAENSPARVHPNQKVAGEVDGSLIGQLAQQEAAWKSEGGDEITYARQREQIYNQFVTRMQ